MVVATTIALYASPPSTVCSTPHQINVSCDLDLNPRSSSSSTTIGGLSLLFKSSPSSSSFASHPTLVGEELPSLRTDDHHRTASLSYSPTKFIVSSYLKRDNHHQSPVSVLHGPISSNNNSPPVRTFNVGGSSLRAGSTRLFNGFIRKAVGSCVDYYETDSVLLDEQLPFAMDDDDEGGERRQPYARDLLRRAQLKHRIFEDDESVIKSFYDAEKALIEDRFQSIKNSFSKFCFFLLLG